MIRMSENERKSTSECIREVMQENKEALPVKEIRRLLEYKPSRRKRTYHAVARMMRYLEELGLVKVERTEEVQLPYGIAHRHYYSLVETQLDNPLWSKPR